MARGGVPNNAGGGRIAADGAKNVIRVTVCIEPHQVDQLKELGGSVFIRQAIRAAAEPAPKRRRPGPVASKADR